MDEDRVTVGVTVAGRVQGVGFRAWTKAEAETLGLSGRVWNDADGTVGAILAGAPRAVQEMVDRLRKGPPSARVDTVDTQPMQDDPEPGFDVTN
ncbi:acylphosphatase [Mesobaculum littorinae]|uniref:acylphosphatase n=1 Tax=Mesobaculum littorinae TaxID=2486419 RepID=A0A438AKS2_9RHOB|nr:acylphosphatase [Mesobaculum littorinae]RVV99206.1 acylphosphatase [Mesobaculum littorinae]